MPNATNNIRGEQWFLCQQCGRQFPMSQLIMQKGRLVCLQICFDNLEVERRASLIAKLLATDTGQEGADLRFVDQAFFTNADEVQY